MDKKKIIIPYKGNENQKVLHIIQVFVTSGVIDMNEAPKYVATFRSENPLSFVLSSENDKDYVEDHLLSLNVAFHYDNEGNTPIGT